MKNYIRTAITLVVLLLSATTAFAQGKILVNNTTYVFNGDNYDTYTGDFGTVTANISEGVCTLTVTPAEGYWISKDYISAIKTIDGRAAQTRTPEFNTPITISGDDVAIGPNSKAYTFTMPANPDNADIFYDVEVTVTFQEIIDITDAVITLSESTFTYNGEEKKPTVTSIKLNNTELNATYYVVSYSNNINAAAADATNAPTVTVTGNGIYKNAATKTFTIGKAAASLEFSTNQITGVLGETFTPPTLTTTPENLEGVKFTSSNTDAATVNETTGAVELKAEGETTITATYAGNDNYNAAEASYVLTVVRGVGTGYPLWIGETQVTEDNCVDILGDRKQAFVYNPDSKILLITNNQDEDIVIESRLDKLTIYLNGNKNVKGNKLKKVFFNNLGNVENKGKLVFTTNYNVPGSIDLKNDQGESVITGFESVEFDSKSKLTFVLPEKTTYEYKNGAMNKTVVDENGTETTSAADELSIGQSLTPIDEIVTFTLNNLYLRDDEGNLITDDSGEPTLPNLVNSVVKDVLITLPGSNDADSGDGISLDDSDGRPGITVETESMTDDKVKTIAQKVISDDDYFPGSDAFANDFVGMTILLPACSGTITTDLNIDPGYEFHALIAEEDNAGNLKSTIRVIPAGRVETPFYVAMPSYCYIYLVKTGGASTRLGKRNKAHGKVYSIGVNIIEADSTNPPSEASGGALPPSEDPVLNTTGYYPYYPSTDIKTVKQDDADSDKWFTIEGQQIGAPTRKGIYIKNGKKIVIK